MGRAALREARSDDRWAPPLKWGPPLKLDQRKCEDPARLTTGEGVPQMGIPEATFYRRKQLYGGLMPSQGKKLRQACSVRPHNAIGDGTLLCLIHRPRIEASQRPEILI
jgi:hypothetical protein